MNETSRNIRIVCPHCKAVLETDGPVGNTAVPCPACGREFVPVPDGIKTKGIFLWHFFRKRPILCILAVLGLFFMISMCSRHGQRELTVGEFQAKWKAQWNEVLSDPNNALNKRIQRAHGPVTVKSAHVVRCDFETIDGSNRAGKDGENIRSCNMLLRFEWEGIVDKGYTDLKVVYDGANDRWYSGIDYTTAAINFEDPEFWESAIDGFVAGWNFGQQF